MNARYVPYVQRDLRKPVPTDVSKEKTKSGIAIIKGNGV